MITRANQSKPCGYIVKPFKNAELIEKINAALASNAKSGSGRHTVKKINRHQFYTGDV
jgi:DNA-binding response OmpR family regulator